jgi:hypothetical protein
MIVFEGKITTGYEEYVSEALHKLPFRLRIVLKRRGLGEYHFPFLD